MEISLIYTEEDIWALGVRSISAMLNKVGHSTKIIIINDQLNAKYIEKVFDNLSELVQSSDLIGISCFSPGSDKAIKILEHMKSIKKMTVWGGFHATLNPQECAKFADIVCIGEGEEFIIDLVSCLGNKSSWKGLQNAVFIDNGVVIKNEVRPLIPDLNEIPPFDFSFGNEYHFSGTRFLKIDHISDPTKPIIFNGTRGCAFNCNYCCNSEIKEIYKGKGKYVRKLTPRNYINGLKNLKLKFPAAKYCNLIDEDFFAYSKEEIEDFARLYKSEINLPVELMGSARNLKKEKLDPLAAIGLWRINMGVESGSERTKKEVYNRFISNDEVIAASELLSNYKGIVLNCFIIIANPFETNEDLLQTIELFKKLHPPYFLTIYNLILYPGIKLFRMAVAEKFISGQIDSGYEMDCLNGLNYQGHSWKNKNLYLNALIYLMAGKTNSWRFGLVPQKMLGFLTNPKFIAFNERHPSATKLMISCKKKLWRARSMIIKILKSIMKNPTRIKK